MKSIIAILAFISTPVMAYDVYDAVKIDKQYTSLPADVVNAFNGTEHRITGKLGDVYFDDEITLFSFKGTRVTAKMADVDETDHPRDAVLDSAAALVDTFSKGTPNALTLSCFSAYEVVDEQGRILVLTDCIYIGK